MTEKAGIAGLFFAYISKISQRRERSMSDAQILAGKVAIVTGAARVIDFRLDGGTIVNF